ncbi:uncharacterized protein LOC129984899 [Argiope bruennichi]|uniref:uncharacterized protein LOC129984899 n=1 Tax=Argiope bruennichi TaxID=94029 RepID=UPI0024942A7C|nr:uncharacterized protein LOC129984899 [Argiope bruennichi]
MGPQNQIPSPSFFIISRVSSENETFHGVSPFLVEKAISGHIGEANAIRKIRSGDLLVEVANKKQAQKILKIKSLSTIPVTVSAHRSLNSSKGVITCGELYNEETDEILKELRNQGVTEVRRITIKRNGNVMKTKHLILTFHFPKTPEFIKAGYMRLAVRPYIPNPLRCFQCQRIGHSKATCRGTLTCARCAEAGHESVDCTANEKCVNCKGEHSSFSRTCPIWQLEKEVLSVKVKNQISYPEAKRIVKARLPPAGISYAKAAKVITPFTPGNAQDKSCLGISLSNNQLTTELDASDAGSPHKLKSKRKQISKSQKSLALKLSKTGRSSKDITLALYTKNSLALDMAKSGLVRKDLTSLFGGQPKSPELLRLHPSEEEDDFQMSCDASATPPTNDNKNSPNNS